jgi:hypothetical protein
VPQWLCRLCLDCSLMTAELPLNALFGDVLLQVSNAVKQDLKQKHKESILEVTGLCFLQTFY